MQNIVIPQIFQILKQCSIDEIFLFNSCSEIISVNKENTLTEIEKLFNLNNNESKKVAIGSSLSFYEFLSKYLKTTTNTDNLVFIAIEEYSNITLPVLVDVRYAAHAALLPLFEPTNVSEFVDLMNQVFSFANIYKTPVVIRLIDTTFSKLMQYSSDVSINTFHLQVKQTYTDEKHNKWQLYKQLANDAKTSTYNELIEAENQTLGIVACGTTYNFFEKLIKEKLLPYPVLKINQYPISRELVGQVYDFCDEIIVFENGRPFVEELIRGIMGRGTRVRGKLDHIIPEDEPLTVDLIKQILGL